MYVLNLNASLVQHCSTGDKQAYQTSLLKIYDDFFRSNSKMKRLGYNNAQQRKRKPAVTSTVSMLLLESQKYMASATLDDLSKKSTFQATPKKSSCLFRSLEMASCISANRGTCLAPMLECSVMYGWSTSWKSLVGIFTKNKESKNLYSLLHLMKHLMYFALGQTSSSKYTKKMKKMKTRSGQEEEDTTSTMTSLNNSVSGIAVDARSGKRLWIERSGKIRSDILAPGLMSSKASLNKQKVEEIFTRTNDSILSSRKALLTKKRGVTSKNEDSPPLSLKKRRIS
jgi:hypothetical protein